MSTEEFNLQIFEVSVSFSLPWPCRPAPAPSLLPGDIVWQGVAGEEPQEQQAGRPLLQQGQQQGQEKVKNV